MPLNHKRYVVGVGVGVNVLWCVVVVAVGVVAAGVVAVGDVVMW